MSDVVFVSNIMVTNFISISEIIIGYPSPLDMLLLIMTGPAIAAGI